MSTDSQPDVVAEARAYLQRRKSQMAFTARKTIGELCDEVERLREQWNTRFNTLCGNCGKRYRGPRDEDKHGIGVCHA